MIVQFEKSDERAKMPTNKFNEDAGLDIFSLGNEAIEARGQLIVRTGIKLKYMAPGYMLQVWPKSGLDSRLGLHTGAGIIDPNYRGELLILLKNMSDIPIYITKGQAIAQLVIVRFMSLDNNVTGETVRGETGGIANELSKVAEH